MDSAEKLKTICLPEFGIVCQGRILKVDVWKSKVVTCRGTSVGFRSFIRRLDGDEFEGGRSCIRVRLLKS